MGNAKQTRVHNIFGTNKGNFFSEILKMRDKNKSYGDKFTYLKYYAKLGKLRIK